MIHVEFCTVNAQEFGVDYAQGKLGKLSTKNCRGQPEDERQTEGSLQGQKKRARTREVSLSAEQCAQVQWRKKDL